MSVPELREFIPSELHDAYMCDQIVHNTVHLARSRGESTHWMLVQCVLALSRQLAIVTKAYTDMLARQPPGIITLDDGRLFRFKP